MFNSVQYEWFSFIILKRAKPESPERFLILDVLDFEMAYLSKLGLALAPPTSDLADGEAFGEALFPRPLILSKYIYSIYKNWIVINCLVVQTQNTKDEIYTSSSYHSRFN